MFISIRDACVPSWELTGELSEHYVSFTVRPFVYQELAEYAHLLGKVVTITDYLIWGGFPRRLELSSESSLRSYISEVMECLLSQIIARHGIRRDERFRHLAGFLFQSSGQMLSARTVGRHMEEAGFPCSPTTATRYISHLEEAGAITRVRRYSTKAGRELEYYLKFYNTDVALRTIASPDGRRDLPRNLENAVYNELLFRNYRIQTYDRGSGSVDFVALKGDRKLFIQTARSVVEDETYRRKFGPFAKLDNSCPKILISNDDLDYTTSTVQHIRFRDLVLMDDL